MGLDIYLYTTAQREENLRHEREWNERYEAKEAGRITQEEYDAQEVAEYAHSDSTPSARYPEHLFNRRYLRSSYNDSGFNHAVPQMIGSADGRYPHQRGSLYWIFEPLGIDQDGSDGDIGPTHLEPLRECKKRAEEVIAALRSSDHLRVMTLSANQFGGLDWMNRSSDEALAMFRKHLAERNAPLGDDDWYSTRDLNVFGGKGLEVIAAIPGGERIFFEDKRWPAMHLIYKASPEGYESYVQSAEIVCEFIDEAMSLIEQDGGAYISWSG